MTVKVTRSDGSTIEVEVTQRPFRPTKMSEGEKLVWAQVYAREYREDIRNPPAHVVVPNHDEPDKWGEWEKNQATSAAEMAWAVVSRMREIGDRLGAGYGETDDVTLMWEQMITDDWSAEEAYQRRVKEMEE